MPHQPKTAEKQPLTEPLVVRGMGTIMGYFRPPKAFVQMVRELNGKINSDIMPEPKAFYTRDRGTIQLIYEWKEEELCRAKTN